MSDEFSLVDCCIAPIPLETASISIELQKDAKTKPIYEYMQRVLQSLVSLTACLS